MKVDLKFISFFGSISDEEMAANLMKQEHYYIPLCLAIGTKGDKGSDYFYVDLFHETKMKNHKCA
ncbi:hypothetical protein [Conservatibacter flavescens]|uniref:Uncharacterized protein n=1 Tax=Conservatibacter flavescens TaxID=28161 RepID=A0A2M8S484_9PAST|nr:hypothetical protein [Conservatibacter flavescens]PJG85955.1 hypothetical protein CVP05_03565 [Conservatibacter flavescens]